MGKKTLKSDDELSEAIEDNVPKEKVLKGRFTIKGRLKVGKSIYVKKMLNVHIAHMERKMRACQRCPPRCNTGLPRVKHPYTTPQQRFCAAQHLSTTK